MKRTLAALLLMLLCAISIQAKTYVVAVGISDYQYINDLRLPENDALTIAKIFKTHTKNVITITGRYATKATILKALNDQFSRATKNDQIVFFFSGHGYPGGFCPYEMRDVRDGLTYGEISAIFKASKATRKIILADACMAGGLRKEKKRTTTSKPASDIMLFLSCRTDEVSIETPRMANGFFTAYLQSGLRGKADRNRDRKITARELFDYVSTGVKNISNDKQHPVMWGKFRDNMTILQW